MKLALTGGPLDVAVAKAALAILTAVMAFMLIQHEISARSSAEPGGAANQELLLIRQRMELDSRTYQEVESLLAQQQPAQAMDKLKDVQILHPGNPRTLLWQARLQYELGMAVDAIASYRQAIDAEPGYVDKKSPLFDVGIIRQLKQRIVESKEKLQRESSLKPGDADIKKALNDLLYLQRRIAGGCE